MSKELAVTERAKKALAPVAQEKTLQELAGKYTDLTEIKDKTDLEMAKGAQSELRTTRTNIEKAGKAAREDANAFAKAVIAEEKKLIGIIQPEEDRIKALREQYEAEQARIKAEQERIERERVAAIAKRIAEFEAGYNYLMASSAIQTRIAELDAIEIDDSFAEFKDQAAVSLHQAKQAAAAALDASIEREKAEAEAEAKRKAEEEAQRAEAERLEKQRQEQERQAAELRAQQEEIERQRREELARIEAERQEQERQAAELRKYQEAAAAALDAERQLLEAAKAEQQRQTEQAKLIEQERKAERERLEAERKAEQERQEKIRAEQARLAAMTLQERIAVWAKAHKIEQSAVAELLDIINQYVGEHA